MEYRQITYEVEDRIARVTMNRPSARNALSRVLLEELDRAFAAAAQDPEVRVVVLAGAGRHFSAGHDIGTPEERADEEERPYEPGLRGVYRRSFDLYIEMGLRWRNLPLPTVAAVQGYCIFGAWMVAAAMDVVLASEDARFLPSAFQYFDVPWDLGIRRTKAILFENRFLSAREAHDLGFVYRVVPRDRLQDEALAYARRVAEEDPFELRMMKLAINQAQDIQGYTAQIHDAHTNYLLRRAEASASGRTVRVEGQRRLGRVDRALAYEKESG